MDTTIALKETLKTAEIAKITGCSVNEVRYRMRHNIWTFGVVRKTGAVKKHYEATISEVAEFFRLSREQNMVSRRSCALYTPVDVLHFVYLGYPF